MLQFNSRIWLGKDSMLSIYAIEVLYSKMILCRGLYPYRREEEYAKMIEGLRSLLGRGTKC
jgi:hypothetical protein